MRWVVLVLGAATLPPGFDLNSLSLAQVHQITRIEDELAQFPDRSITDPSRAELNLYGNYSLLLGPAANSTQLEDFVAGTRVQVRGGRVLFKPVPAELRAPGEAQDRKLFFEPPAAALLSFLSRTVAEYPDTPDVDVVFAHSDFCFGVTRKPAVSWGMGPRPAKLPPDEPPPELASDRIPPVFTWSSSRGAQTCDAVTTTTYDWSMPIAVPTVPDGGPPWAQRKPVLGWRGSLIGEGARARIVHAALGRAGMDIKFTGGSCGKYLQDAAAFGASERDCAGATGVLGPEAPVSGAYMPLADQQAWKFVLDVDGGGSTWRLKTLLQGGWAVFKVVSENGQFWFSQLVPFVHYIPLSLENIETDLPEKLAWALAHDEDCARIAANARQFAEEHLTRDALHWQQHAALALYAQKVKQVEPDDKMTLFCCKDVVPDYPGLAGECADSPGCGVAPAAPGLEDARWQESKSSGFQAWARKGGHSLLALPEIPSLRREVSAIGAEQRPIRAER